MEIINLLFGAIAVAAFAYIGVISIYIGLITLGAWLTRGKSAHRKATPKVAIIVPAHNEQDGIGTTLDDLRGLDYPDDACQVFVIADNCTDRTAQVARSRSVRVSERKDPQHRGKGQALDWFVRSHREELEGYELIAFIDADMRVDAQFLSAIARSFDDRETLVVQGRYTITPDASSWLAAIGFASFAYVNHVRLAGKRFWGGAATLKGSGMVFRSALILEMGWPAHSITEDIEFGKELLLRGIRVSYEPRAAVTSNIPSTLAQVAVQQSRWEGGNLQVAGRFLVPALKAWLRTPSRAILIELLDLLVPPLSLVLLITFATAVLGVLSQAIPLYLFALPICAFGAAVVTGLVHLRAPKKVWLMLLSAPAFALWKLVLLARVAVGARESEWRRTPRDASR